MKAILSILLAACLSLSLLVGCDKPTADDKNNTKESTSTSESGNNSSANDSSTSTDSTGSSDNTGATDSTESTGSTEGTEGTPGPDSTLTGEQITEDQFSAIKTNCPTNYTYTETRTYNGKTEVITMMVSGEEYLETITEAGNVSRKLLGVLRDGTVKTYEFNETSGNWETSKISKTLTYPLKNFPMALSDFTFDAAKGAYIYTMSADGMTAELQLMFRNGQLVYLGQLSGTDEDHVFFSDYGTTQIPVPAESDIIEKEFTQNNTVDKG